MPAQDKINEYLKFLKVSIPDNYSGPAQLIDQNSGYKIGVQKAQETILVFCSCSLMHMSTEKKRKALELINYQKYYYLPQLGIGIIRKNFQDWLNLMSYIDPKNSTPESIENTILKLKHILSKINESPNMEEANYELISKRA